MQIISSLSEALTIMTLVSSDFWDDTPRSLVEGYCHFAGIYYPHLQYQRVNHEGRRLKVNFSCTFSHPSHLWKQISGIQPEHLSLLSIKVVGASWDIKCEQSIFTMTKAESLPWLSHFAWYSTVSIKDYHPPTEPTNFIYYFQLKVKQYNMVTNKVSHQISSWVHQIN
jgi:hypothetical protein